MKESNLRLQIKSLELNHSANGAWRKVKESNPRLSHRPGFQDQLRTTTRYPPWCYSVLFSLSQVRTLAISACSLAMASGVIFR